MTEAGLRGAALHYAAGKGWLLVVQQLLRAGAQVDCEDLAASRLGVGETSFFLNEAIRGEKWARIGKRDKI